MDTAVASPLAEPYRRFREAYLAGDYDLATSQFLVALDRDPEGAFRYFMVVSNDGSLPHCLTYGTMLDAVGSQLDALLADYPTMTIMSGLERDDVRRIADLRRANIANGLPSALLLTQGKSGSVTVAAIFNLGFNLPSSRYSIQQRKVIGSWARDYLRGGVCHGTHLWPSAENLAALEAAGARKLFVHTRDPRQVLVSTVHHLKKYPEQLPQLQRQIRALGTVAGQAVALLDSYIEALQWISGWLDATDRFDIHFSTFEELVADRAAFVDRYLAFFGADRRSFSYQRALSAPEGTDFHFRLGSTDEWREVFTGEEAARLTAMIPDRLKDRFGWR